MFYSGLLPVPLLRCESEDAPLYFCGGKGDDVTIKCSVCGQLMESESDLIDGQHVKCPSCGETTVYRKPSRIALPTVGGSAGVRKPVAPSDDVPELPIENKKPKLALRRPGNIPTGGNPADNALVKNVKDRLKAESRRRFWQGFRTKVGNFVSIVVLLAVLFIGWKVYRHFTWEKISGDTGRLLDAVSEGVKSLEQSEVESPSQVQKKAEELVETVKDELKELASSGAADYKRVCGRFDRAEVSYWGKLNPTERPGSVDAVFSLLVPFGKTIARYYEIVSSPTGIVSIVKHDVSGTKKPLTQAEYEALVAEHGGFFACNGAAYYVSAKKNPKTWMAPLKSGESFEPGKSYFGLVEPFIGKCRMKTSEVSFEVLWSLAEGDEPVKVGEARMNDKVYFSQFKQAAEPIVRSLREKKMGNKPTKKNFRQTVVFYDGSTIASGMNGVTKVPRMSPHHGGTGYQRWIKLCDEARRQESKSLMLESEYQRATSEWRRKIEAPVPDEEAARVLAAGYVRLKRK